MSDKTHLLLNRVVAILTILGVAFALTKTAVLIPRDIEDLKNSDAAIRGDIREMRDMKRQDHDLLQRIDERLQAVQEQQRQVNAKLDRLQ